MTIDTIYTDISKELQVLPSDASVTQKIEAVFRGIENSCEDLQKEFTLRRQIFGVIENSHKLNHRHAEDHAEDKDYLYTISDYHNHFNVVKETGLSSKEINFVGGSESLYRGDVTFHLGESGTATCELQTVNSNGDVTHEILNILIQMVWKIL